MKTKILVWLIGAVLLMGVVKAAEVNIQRPLEDRVAALEQKRWRGFDFGDAFLYGSIAALWAQFTKRNPWLWYFLGLCFGVITMFVMLYKNALGLKNGEIHYASKEKAGDMAAPA